MYIDCWKHGLVIIYEIWETLRVGDAKRELPTLLLSDINSWNFKPKKLIKYLLRKKFPNQLSKQAQQETQSICLACFDEIYYCVVGRKILTRIKNMWIIGKVLPFKLIPQTVKLNTDVFMHYHVLHMFMEEGVNKNLIFKTQRHLHTRLCKLFIQVQLNLQQRSIKCFLISNHKDVVLSMCRVARGWNVAFGLSS